MLDDLSVYLAEFIGTAILTLLGCGVVAGVSLARSKSFQGGWIVVTFGWGMAVAMAVYIIGHISGGHINPDVTLGLASIGDFPWTQVPGYLLAQVVGGATGAVTMGTTVAGGAPARFFAFSSMCDSMMFFAQPMRNIISGSAARAGVGKNSIALSRHPIHRTNAR